MLMAAFLFSLTWGLLSLFFLLLVRIGAKPVPAPPERWSTKRYTLYTLRLPIGLERTLSSEYASSTGTDWSVLPEGHRLEHRQRLAVFPICRIRLTTPEQY
jgi:hypothetical protein